MIVGASEDDYLRRNPPHPGGMFKRGWLDADDVYPGMSVSEAAAKLGVSRAVLSRVANERAPITLNLALKMETLGWSTADNWLELQTKYDLAQARKRLHQPLAAAPAVLRRKQLLAEAEAGAEEAEAKAAA